MALPQAAYALALAAVPGVGPRRLRALLDGGESPSSAWRAVVAGAGDDRTARRLAAAAAGLDPAALWRAHAAAGLTVTLRGDPEYPAGLAEDPEAPALVVCLGRPDALQRRPRVAVVGTRAATRYGLGVAATLGAELSAAGVVVVSGLALGIDGAAHEGATGADVAVPAAAGAGAPPLGVVAGSPATPYPPQHRHLWRRVTTVGAIISESPIGTADLGWRFPLRNRLIAALSDVVVVVECHAAGGALHTVRAANRRGRAVGAVPGSVRSPASVGTNALLADGCFVVRDTLDVLAAVSLATAAPVRSRAAGAPAALPPADGPDDPVAATVLEAIGWEACAMEELMGRTGLALSVLAAALERLRSAGAVVGRGGVWERA